MKRLVDQYLDPMSDMNDEEIEMRLRGSARLAKKRQKPLEPLPLPVEYPPEAITTETV